MKKLLCILVALSMVLGMATMVSAYKTADIKHQSVEGTAVIDGVKDDAYANALALPIIQKGNNNGGGELLEAAIGTAYYLNDAEWVYVYVEVIDDTIDNTSANNYEQDSVELCWMADNSKNQLRFHYDGTVDVDSGAAPESVAVMTDTGYAIEVKFPITDVLNNEIETCVQVNYCADGARLYTAYIEGNGAGDDAYQRSNRQSDYDVWWTLILAGEHADTRVDPVPEPMELTVNNYQTVQTVPTGAALITQNNVRWDDWAQVGSQVSGIIWTPMEINWTGIYLSMNTYDADNTNNFQTLPTLNISLSTGDLLKLPEGAAEGDVGDKGEFTWAYTDVVLKAEGYADVVIPAGEIHKELQVNQASWGRAGDSYGFELNQLIIDQLGISKEEFCTTYVNKLDSLTTTITLTAYNLVTKDIMDAYLVQLDAEDEALIVTLQEYADKVAAALESAKGTTDAAALEELVNDAQKAVNRATKEAEGYPKATEWATGLQASVDEISALLEAANAPAEEEAPAEEPAETPAEEKPADTKPADTSSKGGSTGLIIGIVAVVVVVVVVVVILLGKKKK